MGPARRDRGPPPWHLQPLPACCPAQCGDTRGRVASSPKASAGPLGAVCAPRSCWIPPPPHPTGTQSVDPGPEAKVKVPSWRGLTAKGGVWGSPAMRGDPAGRGMLDAARGQPRDTSAGEGAEGQLWGWSASLLNCPLLVLRWILCTPSPSVSPIPSSPLLKAPVRGCQRNAAPTSLPLLGTTSPAGRGTLGCSPGSAGSPGH